jgi:hypothetical protein
MNVARARAAFARLRGGRRLWAWSALAAALGIGLGRVPLFGVLGFELATATALFAAVMGLDLGSALARTRQRAALAPTPEPATLARAAPRYGRAMARATAAAAGRAIGVALIPGAIAAVRGLWTPTCDWGFGVLTYLAMPVVTAGLAGAVGHAMGVVCGPRRFVAAAAAQLPALAVAAAALWRFYSEPPVVSYNAILGYFPGNLYDEHIRIGWPLLWSRLEDAGWAAALIAVVAWRLDVARHRVAWRAPRRLAGLAVASSLVAGTGVLHLCGGALGYAVDADDIARVLSGRIETEHFVIHYARRKEIDDDIALIARDHEFRYRQVVAQLGAAPAGKLRSFYFADRDQKARWFGARDVEMAKPWRREIYLDHRGFPHGSLRHEIAHVVASAFGDPVFGVATRRGVFANPGLIEGLAVAVDWPGGYERPTPHEAVRAMRELGPLPSLGQLLSLEFFSVSSARGYTIAGSFLRFLLDDRGAERLRALYRSGGDFPAAYGASLAELEAAWRAMIGKLELPPGASEAARERFRGGSVFARPCPHAIAARRARAGAALGTGDRATAVALLRAVCRDAPDEPRHRLELADLLHSGDASAKREATAILHALHRDATRLTSTLRVEVLERLARAAAAGGDRAAVEAWIGEAAALPIDAGERRQIEAKVFALAQRGPAAVALFGYFFAPAPLAAAPFAQAAVDAEPQLGFAHYLLGLQQLQLAQWADATRSLDRALALGLPGPAFVRNAARRLALAAYRSHDAARIATALATLSGPETTASDRLLAADWQDRLAFDASR